MEKYYRERVQNPPAHRRCDYPSFSSTLLDSIYRSIDEETNLRRAPARSPTKWAPPPVTKAKPPRGAPDRTKRQAPAVIRPHCTSSSSDGSSYGGFSSSEPESAPVVNRLKPIRTGSYPKLKLPPPAPMPPEKKKNQNPTSIRSKFHELKKSRPPTSPAARLSGFLNSLFAPKQKTPSTVSSVSRSCLVKRRPPSSADNDVKRYVRFEVPVEPRESRRMTWRDLEEQDDDVASDTSSDLFELDNLTAIGRYCDELPVYETTHLGRLVL